MTSDEFREIAHDAVESVGRFIECFPEMGVTIRIEGPFGAVIVGIEPKDSEPEIGFGERE